MRDEYRALGEGAALQLRADGGALLLADADRVDFLQRMTTNNIVALRTGQATGQSCVTVLTSPTAKIVHVFTVLAQADDLLLLPARGETAALARTLRGQIFFMDKVRVEDRSAAYARMRLMGPRAGDALAAVGWPVQGLGEGGWIEQDGVLIVCQTQYDLPGYELLVDAGREAEVRDRLLAAHVTLLGSDDAYQARRVELGRPLPGAELVGEYNPLEAGLAWACAENKGCYTGQEIIARQITYDKVTRALVGVTAVAAAELPVPGASLQSDGRSAGAITSAAWSPALNQPVGLAVVKRPLDAPGTVLQAGEGTVQVAALPLG